MIKKLALSGYFILAFLLPINTLAVDNTTGGGGSNRTPDPNTVVHIDKAQLKGFSSLGDFITKIITVAFAVAILVALVMLIWGAFEWITSGGDKETVGKARGRIINALIGLAVLAVAFALAKVAGQFLGFQIENITIPSPNPSASGL